MENCNKYLLQIKRTDENNKVYVETNIVDAFTLLHWLEYRDLDENYCDYQYCLIDTKTYRLYKCSSFTKTISYETGAHYRYICKGKKLVYDGDIVKNLVLDSSYFTSDH